MASFHVDISQFAMKYATFRNDTVEWKTGLKPRLYEGTDLRHCYLFWVKAVISLQIIAHRKSL